jgi:hypothetical protein
MATQPPKESKTKDNYDHHTSPNPVDKPQTRVPATPRQNVITRGGNRLQIPMHVTKHSNPVGRPRGR